MRFSLVLLYAATFFVLTPICTSQSNPKPEEATTAVWHALETHDIVMIGEIHGNKQEYEWLTSLIATPEFADRVDDIVMEFGNSLYQKSVDRYIAGEDVPVEHHRSGACLLRRWRTPCECRKQIHRENRHCSHFGNR